MNHPLLTRIGIFACLVLMVIPVTAQEATRRIEAVRVNTSEPLRDIIARGSATTRATPMVIPNKFPRATNGLEISGPGTPGVQTDMGLFNTADVLLDFEGSSDDDNDAVLGFRINPPDTDGDVGPDHYVQGINLVAQIFDKSGTSLMGPFPGNDFFDGLGGICETTNSGDPIVLYDHMADRWLVTQFALGSTFSQCVAVSVSGDPTGAYHQYEFPFGSDLPDYPKFGIMETAYYYTARLFGGGAFYDGIAACAMDRSVMLDGDPSSIICFGVPGGSTIDGYVPADLDGPSAGGPGLIVGSPGTTGGPDVIEIYELDPSDFDGGETFVLDATIPVSPFDHTAFTVPQPAPGELLDVLPFATMLHGALREDQGHRTLLTNHSVDVGASQVGIRWYELRDTGAGWGLYQEGTYAPDGDNRWMGSIAMNGSGDIALGYSVSSISTFPAIRFAGQTADASGGGILNVTETSIIEGPGVQIGSAGRWGDYSAMSVDPSDDMTFWYTNEYYANTEAFDFKTRIAAFTLGGGGGGGDCEDANVTMIDGFGFFWCWEGSFLDGAVGPGGADGVTQPPLACATDGFADVPLVGTVDAYPEASSTGVVCQAERLFQGEAVNEAPDGCDVHSDSFTYDGTRNGMLAYSGPWTSYCDGDPLASGEWSGTFDQSLRAPQVQRRAALPMLGKRALRRAERGLSRADRVRKGDTEGPVEFALEQNYPNPFNPSTQVRFALAEASNVSLRVYNLLGQEVAVLASGRMEAGRHEVQFDASQLTAGVYLYVLEAGDFTATKRLTLLK